MTVASYSVVLERYELLGKLGEGGYGVVYEARDRETGERIALKELTHVSATSIARFKNEFRAVQEVHHANLVRLDALFEDRGKWLIGMELVEGTDLLSYLYASDRDLGYDEGQLRAAFLQLAEGLQALHSAGFVHRDLKPSNVRVTREGRVVLLDFGLATALDVKAQSTRASALGTLAYMAPEQASSAKLTAAADWYAFGVCLYEALTGILPLEAESPVALLLAKQQQRPPLASAHAPGTPPDLDELCARLLSIAPNDRPSGRQVRSYLAQRPTLTSHSPSQPAQNDTVAFFAGRERELSQLIEALAEVRAGGQRAVLIEGDSGIGKSALVDHFLSSQGEAAGLVLRSRCYENELLGFKAFDGAIDNLARILSKLDRAERARVLPPRAALLSRLFPVLSEVKTLDHGSLQNVAADPAAQRVEAFALLIQLLANLSRERTLVLAIDDIQWADVDSFRLLSALLTTPTPLRVLILATVRPQAELEASVAPHVERLRSAACVRSLSLPGLPAANAQALARELMGPLLPDAWLAAIVEESGGHPLFLTVLARFAESHDPKSAAELTLDAAIAARIGALPSKARRLLETVALVDVPTPAAVCGRAAGLQDSDLVRVLADLCKDKLLRRRRAGQLTCFHDRIRRVVSGLLPSAQQKSMHAAIASALASQGHADASELARHYEAAGENALALAAYRRGAEKASSTLAFLRAAALYERALLLAALLPASAAEITALRAARADALARGGMSEAAAREYMQAAAQAEGAEQTRLRSAAAQQLLQSAQAEAGIAATNALLDDLGVGVPSGAAGRVASLLWDRACIGMSGLKLGTPKKPLTERERMQLEALRDLSLALGWFDPIMSGCMNTTHLRLAAKLGQPTHLATALADEAFSRVMRAPEDQGVDALLAQARKLCDGSATPELEIRLLLREAYAAQFRWQLLEARDRLDRAQRLGTEKCADQPWLLTNVRMLLGLLRGTTGAHQELALSSEQWLTEARERNDRFALAVLSGSGFGFFRHLMRDDPDTGRAELTSAYEPLPRAPLTAAHLGEFVAVVYCELYRGGASAYAWLQRELPRLSGSLLYKMGFAKSLLHSFAALATIAALRDASADERKKLLDETEGHCRALSKLPTKFAQVSSDGLLAEVHLLRGDMDRAMNTLARVRQQTTVGEENFLLHTKSIYLSGVLLGGDEGRAMKQAALAAYAERGWRDPKRAVLMLGPTIELLER